MKLKIWKDGDPPAGFKLGPVPTDFGAGRAAYKWRDAIMPYELNEANVRGRILEATIYRGEMYIERQDGSIQPISQWHNYTLKELIGLMKEVAFSGFEDLT